MRPLQPDFHTKQFNPVTTGVARLVDLLIPTISNDFKAGLLNGFAITGLVLVVLILNISWLGWQNRYQVVKGSTSDLTPSQIISLTNLERAKIGVGPVRPNALLTQAAQAKAENMVATGQFNHYYEADDHQINPWQFILESGYDYYNAGENLGKDFYTAEDLVHAWIESPAHKANLLSDKYTEIGVAVVDGGFQGKKDSTLIVQLFASPIGEGQVVGEGQDIEISTTPVLERKDSFISRFFRSYPFALFVITSVVSGIILFVLILDTFKGKKLRRQKELARELWYH